MGTCRETICKIVTEKEFLDLTDSRSVHAMQRHCDREGAIRFH